jgi:hypothetical protein
MRRSIKSGQRKMRVIALKVNSTTELADILDKDQVSIAAGVITFNVPFGQEPVIMAQGSVTLSNKSATSVEVDGACELLIVGSDTSERY